MAKVLIINGSPRPKGCTARALRELSETLEAEGVETETIVVGNRDIRGCIACRRCRELGKCVFDDLVNEVAPKFEEAAGIVVGTPVYFAHANGGALAFIDRLFYSTNFDKTMKVGAAVISSRRGGSTSAFDDINKYFTISGMPVVSSTYWNEVHGQQAEQVEEDLEGLQTMRNLGRNMAFLVRAIEAEAARAGIPQMEREVFTNFVR